MPRNAVARPWPPPRATTAGAERTTAGAEGSDTGTLPLDVAVLDARREAEALEHRRQLRGEHYAPVPSTGAADADREVRLALADVRGEQQREQVAQLVEERVRLRLRHHVLADRGVGAALRSQVLDPVRVRQEAAVEHEVDVERQAVLVAERHDAGLERGGAVALAEAGAEAVAQLVDVEVAGVDDEVGAPLELVEQLALRGDAVGHAVVGRERVLAARRL